MFVERNSKVVEIGLCFTVTVASASVVSSPSVTSNTNLYTPLVPLVFNSQSPLLFSDAAIPPEVRTFFTLS